MAAARYKPSMVSPYRLGTMSSRPLLGEEFTLFRAESPPTLEEWEHQQMIVDTTCCARKNVRMR
jgi:hypothetical protein